MKTYTLDKIFELKENFKSLFIVSRKIKALDHFGETGLFKHTEYLSLIKICIEQKFPTQKESDFLDYLLGEYHLKFLDWAHKTKWVKWKITKMAKKVVRPIAQQPLLFDISKFDRHKNAFNVPIALLNKQQKRSPARRV